MTITNPAEIAGHARWLLDEAEPGDWSMAAMRRLVTAGGWQDGPQEAPDGVRLVPFDAIDAQFSDGRGCRELTLPVAALPEGARSPRSLADVMLTNGASPAPSGVSSAREWSPATRDCAHPAPSRPVPGSSGSRCWPPSSARCPPRPPVDGDTLAATLINVLRTEKASSPARLAVATAGDSHTVLFGLGLG